MRLRTLRLLVLVVLALAFSLPVAVAILAGASWASALWAGLAVAGAVGITSICGSLVRTTMVSEVRRTIAAPRVMELERTLEATPQGTEVRARRVARLPLLARALAGLRRSSDQRLARWVDDRMRAEIEAAPEPGGGRAIPRDPGEHVAVDDHDRPLA